MDGLLQFFKTIGTGKLIAFAGVILVAIFVFSSLLGELGKPPMATLYAVEDPSEANAIVQQLEAQGVPFELAAGGTVIRAPGDQVDRLRLSLAGQGITGQVIGNEIFDRDSGFGRTSFELEVAKTRATEGELTRTINGIRGVNSARVHINIPQRNALGRTANQPTASVMVVSSGGLVGESQARTIQALVAGAVEGLSVDNVTVADSTGRSLAASGESSIAGANSIDEARLVKEDELRNKILQTLEAVVGAGRARAQVSMQLTRDRIVTRSEAIDPDGVVTEQETQTTETSGSTTQESATSVGANQPDAGDQNNSVERNTSNDSREIVRSDFGRTITERTVEPGQLMALSVAVQVAHQRVESAATDGTMQVSHQAWDPAIISGLEEQVRAMLPMVPDTDSNLQFSFNQFPWPDPPAVDPLAGIPTIAGFKVETLLEVVQPFLMFVLALLVIMIVVKPVIGRVLDAIPEAPTPEQQAALADQSAMGAPALTGPDGEVNEDTIAAALAGDEEAATALRKARSAGGMSDDMKVASRIDVAQVEGRVQESAVSRVAEIVRGHPEESTAIIRSWLYAD